MDIEILGTSNMLPTGSYLLRALQNESTPLIDLMVRESIQNSLDAGISTEGQYVEVSYTIGKFEKTKFNSLFDKINDTLENRFPEREYSFISIRDIGTCGLTGKMNKDEVEGTDYGNLVKLVYDFGKPNTTNGAGGSWGIGKTIYYRIGIGLVIFYSRIKKEDDTYESRLAACMIENETKSDSIIPSKNGMSKSGIAWWGNYISKDSDKTIPITDTKEIAEILSIFEIPEYEGVDTGTTVIIPYIDEEYLLKHNINLNDDSDDQQSPQKQTSAPNWYNFLDEYLRITVQRWYYSRLNNKDYESRGKYLKVSINNEDIDYQGMIPVFKVMQALYNRAAFQGQLPQGYTDYLSNLTPSVAPITVNKFLVNTTTGYASFIKVDRSLLKMCQPDNFYDPYLYFGVKPSSDVDNDPVLAFCRMPGMTVSYVTKTGNDGEWLNNVPSTTQDEYILAQYVLESGNMLRAGMSLEEYIRQSEMADHTSWRDHAANGTYPTIITRIKRNTALTLAKAYTKKIIDPERPQDDLGLSGRLGDLLLPPQGFGNKPTVKRDPNPNGDSGGKKSKAKDMTYTFYPTKTEFGDNTIVLYYSITTTNKKSSITIDLNVSSESGDISSEQWEEGMGLVMPFEIVQAEILIESIDDVESEYNYILDFENSYIEDDLLKLDLGIRDNSTTTTLLSLVFNELHKYKINLKIKLYLYSKEQQPSIKLN